MNDTKGEKPKKIMLVNNLMILQVGVYKDHHFFLQRMGNAFQYVIFKDGQFYQAYINVNPDKGQDDFTHEQLVEVTNVIHNFMETTVEALMKKADPKYETTGERMERLVKEDFEKKKLANKKAN